MLEQKLIVGRYIHLTTPAPTNAAPAVAGVQELNRVVLNLAESSSSASAMPAAPNLPGISRTLQMRISLQRAGQHIGSQLDRQRVSTTAVGQVAKAHRNFVWLEWLSGMLSIVRSNGVDVLTGPMSGCWITEYMENGVRYIGHVGTVNNALDPASVAARTAWNTVAAGIPIGARAGFNPFNDWVGPPPAQLPGEGASKFFALVTAAGTFHTIFGYSQANMPNRVRIAGIQQLHSSLPANGQI